MKKQKVVRSYSPNCGLSAKELETALKDGYQLVRASEYIPSQGDKAGYIEYILEKGGDTPEEEKLKQELEKTSHVIETLRKELCEVIAEKENLEACIEEAKYSAALQRKDTLKALVMLTEMEDHTENKPEPIYMYTDRLHSWTVEVKSILKKAISATEEEIREAATETSEAQKEGDTEK